LHSCSWFVAEKKKQDKTALPPNVLGRDRFSSLLVDFAIAESASNLNIRNVQIQKVDSAYAFDPLKDHGVRKSQYDSTLLFYSQHPTLYRQVYDSMLVKLAEIKMKRLEKQAPASSDKKN